MIILIVIIYGIIIFASCYFVSWADIISSRLTVHLHQGFLQSMQYFQLCIRQLRTCMNSFFIVFDANNFVTIKLPAFINIKFLCRYFF